MRILIVDDHPLFREALNTHLANIYAGASVFEAASVAEAVGAADVYGHFDLVVLDLGLPDMHDLDGLEALRTHAPDARFVIMSGLDDPILAKASIEHGANGYIAKSAGGREVRNALQLILAGEIYISPSMLVTPSVPEQGVISVSQGKTSITMPTDELLSSLTPRQRDVLRLMAQGLPNKSIARQLNCSDGTVKLHVSAILRALHARNRTEAVQSVSRLHSS